MSRTWWHHSRSSSSAAGHVGEPDPQVTYLAAFNDLGVEFQYALDAEPWSEWSRGNVWPSRTLPDGRYSLRVRSRDAWGNVESPPESLSFEIDATPPSALVFWSPARMPRSATHSRSVATAADARFAWYRLETRAKGAGTWTTLADTTPHAGDRWCPRWLEHARLADGKYELRLSSGGHARPGGIDCDPGGRWNNQFPFAAQTSPALVTAAAGGDVYTDERGRAPVPAPAWLARDTIVTVTALDSTAVPAALRTVRCG